VRRVPARWLRGAVTAVLGVALVLLVSATVLALVESAATSLAPRAPLSRAELGGELPHLARLARRHAGTELGAPRIRRHPDRFVLRYRGRGACRVVMSVTRDADATPAPPVVWTTGCG
jgi:hypothetical protein